MKEKKLQSRMGTLYILLSIQMGASLNILFCVADVTMAMVAVCINLQS
jgi:hypothetical protein